MKAAVLHGPDRVPEYADFEEPPVPSGRELVELAAAGLHPVVRSLASGRHYGSTGAYPLIPGVDAVARTADGGLVYTGFVQSPYGTLAEHMAVPATMKLPLPDGAGRSRSGCSLASKPRWRPGQGPWPILRVPSYSSPQVPP